MLFKRILSAILLLAGLTFLVARTAFGYLDPGAGSFACQVLLAGIVGTLFLVKTYWRRIRGYLAARMENDSKP